MPARCCQTTRHDFHKTHGLGCPNYFAAWLFSFRCVWRSFAIGCSSTMGGRPTMSRDCNFCISRNISRVLVQGHNYYASAAGRRVRVESNMHVELGRNTSSLPLSKAKRDEQP